MKGGETLNMKSHIRMKIPMIRVGKGGLGGTMIGEGGMRGVKGVMKGGIGDIGVMKGEES